VAKNFGKLVVMLVHKSGARIPVEHPDLGGNTQDAVRWAREQPEIPGFGYIVQRDMALVEVVSTMSNTATVTSLGGGDGDEGNNGGPEEPEEPEAPPETVSAPMKPRKADTAKDPAPEPEAQVPPTAAAKKPGLDLGTEPGPSGDSKTKVDPPDSPF